MVHCSEAKSVCRSRPIAGRATLTTVASMPASPDPRMDAASTHRPRADPNRRPGLAPRAVSSDGPGRDIGRSTRWACGPPHRCPQPAQPRTPARQAARPAPAGGPRASGTGTHPRGDTPVPMSRLVLGPLLRHVGTEDATVWVETDSPCTVEVLGCRERTWTVAGHHYALVCVEGLQPGTTTTYDVRLDGEVVWPLANRDAPPSRIRTLGSGRPLRLAFGSCRYATPAAVGEDSKFDADALDAFARRMMVTAEDEWPDALALLGDQVYADETSESTRRRIRARRDIT